MQPINFVDLPLAFDPSLHYDTKYDCIIAKLIISAYKCYFYITGTILPGPRSFIFHPGITPLPIQLTCEFSPYVIGWKVNNRAFVLFQLASNGYDIIGNNLLINNPQNNSEFNCTNGETPGQLYYIFIAGKHVHILDVK